MKNARIAEHPFRLRFDAGEIGHWAGRYVYPGEAELIRDIVPPIRDRGFMTRAELVALARWKSPRIGPRIMTNSEADVVEVTRESLAVESERLRIWILMALSRVGWPMASVILHFCHRDPYPILDYRALWSLGRERQPAFYTFRLWEDYVTNCRALAVSAGVDMRTIDRALWQYSKERQAAS